MPLPHLSVKLFSLTLSIVHLLLLSQAATQAVLPEDLRDVLVLCKSSRDS